MGEVYRATDRNLGRQVAIKVLPDTFAHDPERLARFEREAKTLAALNHSNIAQIYGFEKADGIRALVMELVEGPTLADRIEQGPITVDEALPIAKQIAEALEAAHEQGIVHRDLKPANIKLRPDGTVKVLDFGLAKALDPMTVAVDATASPTITSPAMMTGVGVLLGTAAYMSPEQARGKAVDKRSDIWAFGCVLYEMLTGQRAFAGDDVSDTLAAVLRGEPDWAALGSLTSASVRRLLHRSLERNPRKRWQSAGDLRVEIEALLDDPRNHQLTYVQQHSRWKLAALVGAAAVVGAGGSAAWFTSRTFTPRQVVHLSFTLPEGQNYSGAGDTAAVISPDGSKIVYQAGNQLYLRRVDARETVPIQGAGPGSPIALLAVSPDSQWVAFWDAGTLKKIATNGGAAVALCPAANVYGADWVGDRIIFAQAGRGILEVSALAGTPELRVPMEPGESAAAPQLLPGGDAVLFTVTRGTGTDRWGEAAVVVHSKATGQRKTLIPGGASARYVSTGHIVYALGGNLVAARFDLARLEVTGAPILLVEDVRRGWFTGQANFSIASDGTFVSVPNSSTDRAQRVLALVSRTGEVERLSIPPASYEFPRISRDGRRIVVQTQDEGGTIWVYDLAGTTSLRRLTFEPSIFPLWSADGQRVMFQGVRDGNPAVLSQPADGSGVAEVLAATSFSEMATMPDSWSPDGKTLLVSITRSSSITTEDTLLSTIQMDGQRRIERFVDAPNSNQRHGVFSPDGRWVAYQSNESGRTRIYVQPFPGTGAKYQVSREAAANPVWSRDGKQLYFFQVDTRKLVAVPITQAPSFSVGAPVIVPVDGVVQGIERTQYDVAPDNRVLIVLPTDRGQPISRSSQQIDVVLGWFSELKRLVPTN
jgi:serine/threonine-protein kinase